MSNTTNTDNDLKLPLSLTLGAVTYNIDETPELKKFRDELISITAAREKNKLYTTIKDLESQMSLLNNVKVVDTKKSDEGLVDAIAKLKGELSTELLGSVKQIVTDAVSPLRQQAANTEKMAINDYRNKLLIENAGKCIPEYVVGETKEALDASLLKAVELYAKHFTTGTPNINASQTATNTAVNNEGQTSTTTNTPNPALTNSQTNTPGKTETPEMVSPGRTEVAQPSGMDGVASMTMDDYTKSREELMRKVQGLVKGNA